MEKYLNIKKYNNGEIISTIIKDLNEKNKFKDILFIRSTLTGQFMDELLKNDENIIRILYNTDKTIPSKEINISIKKVHSNELEKTINSLNKKFDLIFVDPFHEYKESRRDFSILIPLLKDNGILISHDCYPENKKMANPNFILGNWSGETYIAFVELAFNNPSYYYGILNIDTGIGIMSKKEFELLKNNLNTEKQKELLYLHQNNNETAYDYFIKNSQEIINMIDIN